MVGRIYGFPIVYAFYATGTNNNRSFVLNEFHSFVLVKQAYLSPPVSNGTTLTQISSYNAIISPKFDSLGCIFERYSIFEFVIFPQPLREESAHIQPMCMIE